jgi:hypothetical protein
LKSCLNLTTPLFSHFPDHASRDCYVFSTYCFLCVLTIIELSQLLLLAQSVIAGWLTDAVSGIAGSVLIQLIRFLISCNSMAY